MAMTINISNIPADGWIAVFGIDKDEETVDGHPLQTYKSKSSPDDCEQTFEIEIHSPRIFIRCGSSSLRWRKDKERYSEISDTYSQDILLEYTNKTINIDMNEYLEHDNIMDDTPPQAPLITVNNHDSYESIHKNKRIILPSISSNINKYSFQKFMVFSFDKSRNKELEKFTRKLPRELMWLFYGPLPLNSTKMEAMFIGYEFGREHGINKQILEREPWRLNASWNKPLEEYRQELIVLLLKWGVQPKYYTSRELSMYKPRFIQKEFSLKTSDLYAGGDPKIWHYFSLPKFLNFIQTKKMWFARPSIFSDPFESKTNKITRAHQIEITLRQLTDEYNMAISSNEKDFISINSKWAKKLNTDNNGKILLTEYSTFEELPIELISLAEDRLDSINNGFLINCWHENELESDGMWGLYSDRIFGIAIASTPERVRKAFSNNNITLQITPIEYHDLHLNDKIFDNLPVQYKHISFQHEREYRIYLSNYPLALDNIGVSIDVDMDILIEKIVLSPECPAWFKDTIKWAITSADLDIEICDSIFSQSLY